jgi:hypothetical protein
MSDDTPIYDGPLIVLAPVAGRFRVSIEPGTSARGLERVFPSKDEAWAFAQRLWTEFRLPLRDLSEGNLARMQHLGEQS